VTRRGVRFGIGPRRATLHVGAGQPGISTGASWLTLYRSLGARRGRRR
jgi:hypothetical protein